MKPPPPVTAICTGALSRVPSPACATRPAPWAAQPRAALPPGSYQPGSISCTAAMAVSTSSISASLMSECTGRQMCLRATSSATGSRRPGVLGEYRLPVQRQVVHLAGQPDPEPVGQLLLDGGPVGAGRRAARCTCRRCRALPGASASGVRPSTTGQCLVVGGCHLAAAGDELVHPAQVHQPGHRVQFAHPPGRAPAHVMVGGEGALALVPVDLRLVRHVLATPVTTMPPSPLVTTFVG